MCRFSLERLRRKLGAERGFALPVALGVSAIMMIAGTSVMGYSSSNGNSTMRWSADQGVFNVAESGLSLATAVLANPANNPFDPALLPPRSTTLPTGTVIWSGTLDRATAIWTLTATGQVRNPTATTPVRRTVSERIRVTPVQTQPVVNHALDYLYAIRVGSSACDVTVSSKVVVSSPLYVSGSLCVSSGGSVAGGPLVVKNKLTLSALDATVGTVSAPLSAAHIGGGCKYYTYLLHIPCSSTDNVYATVLDSVVPAVTAPTVDWDLWYRNAAPGPLQSCTTVSGTPPVFENESSGATRNNSVPGSFSLTPPVSYTCRVGPADTPTGELSWDASTRTLKTSGRIFIDGSAKVDNGLVNTYTGQGTLYLSGTFLFSSGSKLCGRVSGSECDFGGWDPKAAMLTIVANGTGGQVAAGTSIQLSTSASFEGALYGSNAVQLGSSAQTKGPITASTILFGSGSQAYTFAPLETAPVGTPGTQVSFGTPNAPQDFTG